MEAEFAALGVPFKERGRRMDEGIEMMRAVWSDDPVSFPSRWIPAAIDGMRMMPKPEKPIPIWIGGTSEPALRRAMRLDGWHGSRATPEQAAPIVDKLRAERPDPEFAISLRTAWDGKDEGALTARLDGFAAVGVGHVMVEPFDRELVDWLVSVERIAKAGAGFLG
jgi:alkanesulfonate monooxygenase SsuD/methylene tetrahydromethanopterin reductase-like flavin-dependent oxidoreductase (luciferase family)